ncbi:DUF3492 domain-containing protein [Streptomyces sp. H10-C2]|uniref:DUF3492 domain-containing protein n=1 Tax=unclassified Streptomyces TaxID=2593676 RepID=UPI0024BBB75A|nr:MULTISPECIES: DUF3492 domain-containing protein [unclassified Streptomyces]MDJ0343877.1 DUF3492 domain-containing protein [Streptomyces sp. PH10-H1]MDJ0373466.1 DUF3492 domain-containing protein [Streptomyces sp. H10-C2]
MRIALLTEGGYPYARGEGGAWCDRLVRGLPGHEFEVYALSRSQATEAGGKVELPSQVRRVRTERLWGAPPGDDGGRAARRARRHRFVDHYRELAAALAGGDAGSDAVSAGSDALSDAVSSAVSDAVSDAGSDGYGGPRADRFAAGLYGLAELAREDGGLPGLLRSEHALRALEDACRAPGVRPLLAAVGVGDLLTAAELLERALRPLSAPWYEADELGAADLCHAVSGGPATLPGLLAKRFFGTPLLVTEYGVRLREALLAHRAAGLPAEVRALLTAFHRLLAGESYREAALITPGSTHSRRWQERCGAERSRLRTVYPGMEAAEAAGADAPAGHADPTLTWVGRADPAKDLIALLHAFDAIRKAEPGARLRILHVRGGTDAYLADCRTLAAQLFPDEARDAVTVGESPVTFEEIGSPGAPQLADAYASGDVVVLSSIVEGFPLSLVEAMFCGRATVSTDVGAVREVIGGTGLVVPPRNPKALADACLALLHDPERSARLGAAARERALELFTVERCVGAFREIYLELVAHCPVRREPLLDTDGVPRPFSEPAEAHVPGRLTPVLPAPAWARRPQPVGFTFPGGDLT